MISVVLDIIESKPNVYNFFTVEMPHINVLSKADLIEKHGKLHFNLDFYTDVLDLEELVGLLSVSIIFWFKIFILINTFKTYG